MITQLKRIYKKEQFFPSVLGVLINPFYFARRLLNQAIIDNHHHLNGKLLDLGCGTKPYQSIFNVSEYIGVEIQDNRDQSNKCVDYFYDGKILPFANNSFDSFFSSQAFEHIFNLEEMLTEIHRVLKPNATLLITLPFAWPEHEQPYDYARYSSFGIQHLLKHSGFEIIKMEKTGNYPIALCQLLAAYIYDIIPKSTLIKLLLTTLLISPFTMLGLLFTRANNKTYYLDNIIVAKKAS